MLNSSAMDVMVRVDPELRQNTDVLYPICEVLCVEEASQHSIKQQHEMPTQLLNIGEITQKTKPKQQPEQRQFKCVMCYMAFKNRYHLNRHMRTHTDDRDFKCDKCGACFKRKEHLSRHTESVHFEVKPEFQFGIFKCLICDEMYSSQHFLAEHSKIHEVAKEIGFKLINGDLKCEDTNLRAEDITGAADGSNYEVKKEYTDLTQYTPFKCMICNEDYSSQLFLIEHLKIHGIPKEMGYNLINGELRCENTTLRDRSSNKRHICEVCQIGFSRNHHLQRHLLSHSDIRQHECPTCHSMFRRKEHLERHKYVHTDLRIHKCPQCEKSFKRREHLHKHLGTHGSMWRPFNDT